jgi:hypothetical protein
VNDEVRSTKSEVRSPEPFVLRTSYFVHGFNASSGANNVGRLRPYFEGAGFRVRELNYGWSGPLRVRLCNRGIALALAALVEPGTIGVGHSNGCAILQRASLSGARFEQLVFVNPALDRGAEIGPQVKRIHVWHSPSDKPVRLARFMLRHPWGDMGAKGYRGADPRFINYDKEHGFPVSSRGHSDVFEAPALEFFGPLIVSALHG